MGLVSIIIPTYNRGHLISETIASIQSQTYQDWECIIVDDGSSDNTTELIKTIKKEDTRIKFFVRPGERIKGANACRNYGFEKSQGNFIIWFDSDDLMTPDHVQEKIRGLKLLEKDFIIARTVNFQDGKFKSPYVYNRKPYGIKASDFILLKIHWYTYDALIKRELAEKVQWNERMRSWQDYNYFCKLLLESEEGAYLDKILTHRRLHPESIQKRITKNNRTFYLELLENRIYTFLDVRDKIEPSVKKELIFGMMNLCFDLAKLGIISQKLRKVGGFVLNNFGNLKALIFYASVFTGYFLKRGNFILETSKPRS